MSDAPLAVAHWDTENGPLVEVYGPDQNGPAEDVARERLGMWIREQIRENYTDEKGKVDEEYEAVLAACDNSHEDAINWWNENQGNESHSVYVAVLIPDRVETLPFFSGINWRSG